jgi:hypothetical protein
VGSIISPCGLLSLKNTAMAEKRNLFVLGNAGIAENRSSSP